MVLNRAMFLRPKNQLEGSSEQLEEQKSQPQETRLSCSGCGREVPVSEIRNHHYICPLCGFYWKMPARVRLQEIAEEGSLIELDEELSSRDLLNFPGYEGKLAAACKMSGENESVITGTARINGVPCAMFAMESQFMMGSMGTVTGEKITRLFEYALQQRLPVVGFCLSGGARMQEGILSLMQMAKVSGAVQRHSEAGLLYIAVLQNPTTGGVTASFAMEGDIILAEKGALIGFAGPRVIEQTLRQKLPENFQSAEFVREKGFVDAIVERNQLKGLLGRLLHMHQKGTAHGSL